MTSKHLRKICLFLLQPGLRFFNLLDIDYLVRISDSILAWPWEIWVKIKALLAERSCRILSLNEKNATAMRVRWEMESIFIVFCCFQGMH